MSRTLDWEKPLSDEDRQWALDRGMTWQVEQNDALGGDKADLSEERQVIATGLRGTEPSSQSDRTEPLEMNPQARGLHTDHAGRALDSETGLPRQERSDDDSDGDKYDEMTKGELREEVDTRNDARGDDEDHIPVSGTAGELRDRLREDDAQQ